MCVHNAVLHLRVWTTWWLWRGEPTRSHLELGREDPQRRWYCVLRRGRVGRCQVFQARGCDHPTAYKPTQTSQHLQSYPPAVLLTQIASADPAARTPQTPQGNNTPAHKSRRATLKFIAGWSSPVARQAHNLKVVGSNPTPATNFIVSTQKPLPLSGFFAFEANDRMLPSSVQRSMAEKWHLTGAYFTSTGISGLRRRLQKHRSASFSASIASTKLRACI